MFDLNEEERASLRECSNHLGRGRNCAGGPLGRLLNAFEAGPDTSAAIFPSLNLMLVLHHAILEEGDRFILSKGHAAGAYYVTLWTLGRLEDSDLRQFHGDRTRLAVIRRRRGSTTSCSPREALGHGVSLGGRPRPGQAFEVGAGPCLLPHLRRRVERGLVLGGLIFARHHKLDNLTVLVDLNGLQGFGTTREVADLEPLAGSSRRSAFRPRRSTAMTSWPSRGAANRRTGPDVIVAHTRKGCGVSFMEDRMEWHYLPMTEVPVRAGRTGNRSKHAKRILPGPGRGLLPPRVRLPDRRPGFQGLRAACATRSGSRFINAGVAEAEHGLGGRGPGALRGFVPGSTASRLLFTPGLLNRCATSCLHRLPVVLVGNGGGYGYGVMGATHHALEDYGALLCLPHLRAYVPAFEEDVPRWLTSYSRIPPRLPAAGAFRRTRGRARFPRTPPGASFRTGPAG